MDQEKVSLATVGGGAAIERFDIALQQVINNILDVNTDARKERSVTLKVTFRPTENRDMGAVSVDVVPKLAPVSAFKTQVFLGTDATGKGMACEPGLVLQQAMQEARGLPGLVPNRRRGRKVGDRMATLCKTCKKPIRFLKSFADMSKRTTDTMTHAFVSTQYREWSARDAV